MGARDLAVDLICHIRNELGTSFPVVFGDGGGGRRREGRRKGSASSRWRNAREGVL